MPLTLDKLGDGEGVLINAKYEPIKRIGHGSYGSVYLAKRTGSANNFVVLKRVLVAEEGSSQHQEAQNEVKLLQRLRHRNIVAYKDSFLHDSHLCIVMSYCAGGDLNAQVRAAREAGLSFTLDQVLEWFVQILEAMRYLHEDKKILHRDLKSQNVFLVPEKVVAQKAFSYSATEPKVPRTKAKNEVLETFSENSVLMVTHKARGGWLYGIMDSKDGSQKGYFPGDKVQMLPSPGRVTVKLGDFGISRSLESTDEMASTVLGTPYYMSPELCEHKPYNHKSDVWALGCLLYEMAALRHAFEAKSWQELVMNVMDGRFPPLSEEHWGVELQSLISGMLKKNPSDRPDVKDMLQIPFLSLARDQFFGSTLNDSSAPAKVSFRKHSRDLGAIDVLAETSGQEMEETVQSSIDSTGSRRRNFLDWKSRNKRTYESKPDSSPVRVTGIHADHEVSLELTPKDTGISPAVHSAGRPQGPGSGSSAHRYLAPEADGHQQAEAQPPAEKPKWKLPSPQEMEVNRKAYGYLQCPVGSSLDDETPEMKRASWSNIRDVQGEITIPEASEGKEEESVDQDQDEESQAYQKLIKKFSQGLSLSNPADEFDDIPHAEPSPVLPLQGQTGIHVALATSAADAGRQNGTTAEKTEEPSISPQPGGAGYLFFRGKNLGSSAGSPANISKKSHESSSFTDQDSELYDDGYEDDFEDEDPNSNSRQNSGFDNISDHAFASNLSECVKPADETSAEQVSVVDIHGISHSTSTEKDVQAHKPAWDQLAEDGPDLYGLASIEYDDHYSDDFEEYTDEDISTTKDWESPQNQLESPPAQVRMNLPDPLGEKAQSIPVKDEI